jgi:type II restriction enzyme
MKTKLSAASSLISDISLVLEDIETKIPSPRLGFSVKSEIGNPATVFNASHSTNVTFRIVGPGIPPFFDNVSPVKSNLKMLARMNFALEFVEYDNPKLQASLENIDSNLPKFLAEVLRGYYGSTTTSMEKVCELTWPLSITDRDLRISKIKKFLSAASMGLRANQVWSGYPQDFGGLLLVKESGDVLFYYLYNLEKFEEYLFRHLRFETPSSNRHGFGQVYFENDEARIKLNIQIRF